MARGIRTADDLLRICPYLQKWLHRCGACQHVGHKPECPDEGPVYWDLRRHFPLLELDEDGLCETCQHQARGPKLEPGARLADGTIVCVEPVSPAPDAAGDIEDLDPLFRMGELAVETGIADLAAEADHYLYGHPKLNDPP
jgi:hypothetical protein